MYDILTRIQGSIIYCIYTCSVVCIVEIKICKKKGKFVIPPPPPHKCRNIWSFFRVCPNTPTVDTESRSQVWLGYCVWSVIKIDII